MADFAALVVARRDAALRARGGAASCFAAGIEQTDPSHGGTDRWPADGARLPRRRLTEAGRLLASRARHLLRDSAATFALSQRAARGEAGLLRIGFGIASLLGLFPAVLLRFRRDFPGVELQLRDMSTPEQIAALRRRAPSTSVSCGCRWPTTACRCARCIHERLVAALGPRSPWTPRLALRSVAAEPFIIIARGRSASFYDHALSICAASGFAPQSGPGGVRAVHRPLAGGGRARRLAGAAVRRTDAPAGGQLPRAPPAGSRVEHRRRLASRCRQRAAGAAVCGDSACRACGVRQSGTGEVAVTGGKFFVFFSPSTDTMAPALMVEVSPRGRGPRSFNRAGYCPLAVLLMTIGLTSAGCNAPDVNADTEDAGGLADRRTRRRNSISSAWTSPIRARVGRG